MVRAGMRMRPKILDLKPPQLERRRSANHLNETSQGTDTSMALNVYLRLSWTA